jgi:hypothetical protein
MLSLVATVRPKDKTWTTFLRIELNDKRPA